MKGPQYLGVQCEIQGPWLVVDVFFCMCLFSLSSFVRIFSKLLMTCIFPFRTGHRSAGDRCRCCSKKGQTGWEATCIVKGNRGWFKNYRWWFPFFLFHIFTPTWGNYPDGLDWFKSIETTNKSTIYGIWYVLKTILLQTCTLNRMICYFMWQNYVRDPAFIRKEKNKHSLTVTVQGTLGYFR